MFSFKAPLTGKIPETLTHPMVIPMPSQRPRVNAEIRSFGNNMSSTYLVFFLTQQGRQLTLNAVRTVPKQNDNTEGRWVLMAAGGPGSRRGQHSAWRRNTAHLLLCPGVSCRSADSQTLETWFPGCWATN